MNVCECVYICVHMDMRIILGVATCVILTPIVPSAPQSRSSNCLVSSVLVLFVLIVT